MGGCDGFTNSGGLETGEAVGSALRENKFGGRTDGCGFGEFIPFGNVNSEFLGAGTKLAGTRGLFPDRGFGIAPRDVCAGR